MSLGSMKIIYLFSLLGYHFTVEANTKYRFPNGFLMGFATSSYQIEGAWNEGGKGENIWDRFVHTKQSNIRDGTTGDIACDSYHKFSDDVQILKKMGADIYRFSLSWARILPTGDISKINKEGVQYYNNLIDELLRNNIQPMVTLYHWDLPQSLQDLGGWPNPILVQYFEDYARLVFQLFGDRVKWWLTFNEPFEVCEIGYGSNVTAPGIDMSGIADYLCAHTIIKAHARAYHIYDEEFRQIQEGHISISLNGGWVEPFTDSEEDKEAAERKLEFSIGWFLHPLVKGDYPAVMRKAVDANSFSEHRRISRLPEFTDHWKNYIRGTLDFLGINHYTTFVAQSGSNDSTPSYAHDVNCKISQDPSWPNSSAEWLKVQPTGFRKLLVWLDNYMDSNYSLFVTENGYADYGELNDQKRINYYQLYLKELLKAIHEDNVKVLGYIAWSIMDNFEWFYGYSVRFGVFHVDFNDPNRRRTAKASASFFKDLFKHRKLKFHSKYIYRK